MAGGWPGEDAHEGSCLPHPSHSGTRGAHTSSSSAAAAAAAAAPAEEDEVELPSGRGRLDADPSPASASPAPASGPRARFAAESAFFTAAAFCAAGKGASEGGRFKGAGMGGGGGGEEDR